MSEKTSVLLFDNNGSPQRHIAISRFFIIGVLAIIMIGFSGVGYIFYDYVKIRKKLHEKIALDRIVDGQKEEIFRQKIQIQTFSSRISYLESEIAELHNFEKKIRKIADFENEYIDKVEQTGTSGMGGPVSESLNGEMLVEEAQTDLIVRMHQQVQHLELAALNQKESFESLFQSLENQISTMASKPSISPTKGLITSTFGYRKSPFTGIRDFHSGLDIAAKTGTPVKATADGKVSFAGKQGYLGNLVIIEHDHGILTRYGHLHKISVNCGDTVKKGEIIGEVGNTGKSTGSHVHYEVHLEGVPVNPLKYILN